MLVLWLLLGEATLVKIKEFSLLKIGKLQETLELTIRASYNTENEQLRRVPR